MYTRCPTCSTCFRVTERHLTIANGKVRCGKCQLVFNAPEHAIDDLPVKNNPATAINDPASSITPPSSVAESKLKIPPAPIAPTAKDKEKIEPSPEVKLSPEIKQNSKVEQSPEKEKVQDEVIKAKEKVETAAIKTTATSGIKSTPKKVSIPNIEKPNFDADATMIADISIATASDMDEDDIFNKDFNLNAAIDELTQSTNEADSEENKTIKAVKVISKVEVKQPLEELEKENNSGGVFSTDAYDATNATSVEDILSEMENQLSFDIEKPAVKEEEYDIESEFDFIQLDEETDQSPSKQENIETNDDVLKKHFDLDEFGINNEPENEKSEEPSINEDELFDQVDLSDFEDSEIQLNSDVDIPLQLRDDMELLQTNPQRRIHPIFSALFIVILITLSFAQLTYFRAHELVNLIPSSRPLLEQFCNEVNCHYSGPVNTKKIQLISRDVRLHQKEKNALLIRAAMINKASFDQPYPNIHVRLSDISGNIVAERVFKAKTYLGKSSNPFLLMKSKTPVHINFEVVDPGKDAINFEFTFL